MRDSLPKSLQHATSRVQGEGKAAIDALGLGLMHSHTSSEGSAAEPPSSSRNDINDRSDSAENQAGSSKIPMITLDRTKKQGLRQRLFGTKPEASLDQSHAEEGRGNPDLLSPPDHTRSQPIPIIEGESGDDALSRTVSNRNPSIRFAVDSSPSSDTAPGIGNYGNNNPAFKRNPALAMFRSSSVQSAGDKDQPSVKFQEPEKP